MGFSKSFLASIEAISRSTFIISIKITTIIIIIIIMIIIIMIIRITVVISNFNLKLPKFSLSALMIMHPFS